MEEDEYQICETHQIELHGRTHTMRVWKDKICPTTGLPMRLSKQRVRFSASQKTLTEMIKDLKDDPWIKQ